ncbi:oxidoreductase [Aspergillus steynii IBT 23096]|uniref:Oxidoreductase n=1 Tax=Aspergillus steynii IBT 23096 TaxID=1392250 RepID=A0A2I2GBD0_9EURO|nr:oxidoreductase [Aspergillus steynii IBT 23096]PLB50192.1 oxidoreductase [Aspergillus steynii IBT 23096]
MLASTQLDGVALVVGSGRGIGQQAALSLAEAGARVVVFADINEETAKESAEQSKQYVSNKDYQATFFKVNVIDEKRVQEMVDFVVQEFGRLDYCVNGAGIDNGVQTPVADTDIENFDRIMNINAKGMMLCVRAQTAAMRKQTPKTFQGRNGTRDIGRGAIVNIASAHSFVGLPGKMSYTMSKHAVMALTKMAGMDHAAEGVRYNAVCPSWVRTPMLDIEIEKNPEVRDTIKAIVPIQRVAEGEEVSDTIAYLLSPAASYITGTSIVIDSGITTTVRLF